MVTVDTRIVAIMPPDAPEQFPAALPGGHGEYGESPEEAAIREAYEETGYHVAITELLGWGFNKTVGYPGPMIHFYYEARAIGGNARDSEEGRVQLFGFEQFPAISPQRGGSRRTMELYAEKMKQRSSR
ncbi:NUDIX hydrolase [Paenibacillus mesophilus]|uniref:NUDIX hydrolase n=1 Tax=Paenibacillus mesophilus TaxID=2582849 RepID=UPI002368986B|nr:NUDIX hydrolase [Paenibacillus mesophilus]